MGSGRKSRAWWTGLTPERRAELKQRQAAKATGIVRPLHHCQDDVACPACGTDSTVGCIAGVDHG